MNPQQRIAAIGTDKELSDLLDFSAVRQPSILFVPFKLSSNCCHLLCHSFLKYKLCIVKLFKICMFIYCFYFYSSGSQYEHFDQISPWGSIKYKYVQLQKVVVLKILSFKMFAFLSVDVFSTCKQWENQANHSRKQPVQCTRQDFLWKSFNERLPSSH